MLSILFLLEYKILQHHIRRLHSLSAFLPPPDTNPLSTTCLFHIHLDRLLFLIKIIRNALVPNTFNYFFFFLYCPCCLLVNVLISSIIFLLFPVFDTQPLQTTFFFFSSQYSNRFFISTGPDFQTACLSSSLPPLQIVELRNMVFTVYSYWYLFSV